MNQNEFFKKMVAPVTRNRIITAAVIAYIYAGLNILYMVINPYAIIDSVILLILGLFIQNKQSRACSIILTSYMFISILFTMIITTKINFIAILILIAIAQSIPEVFKFHKLWEQNYINSMNHYYNNMNIPQNDVFQQYNNFNNPQNTMFIDPYQSAPINSNIHNGPAVRPYATDPAPTNVQNNINITDCNNTDQPIKNAASDTDFKNQKQSADTPAMSVTEVSKKIEIISNAKQPHNEIKKETEKIQKNHTTHPDEYISCEQISSAVNSQNLINDSKTVCNDFFPSMDSISADTIKSAKNEMNSSNNNITDAQKQLEFEKMESYTGPEII